MIKESGSDAEHEIQEYELTAERAAQVNSVLRILLESIEKIKISLILPRIFENPITLRQYLSSTKYEECVIYLEHYLKKNKNEVNLLEPHKNFQLIRVIDIFHENHKMLELLPTYLDDLVEDDICLLDSFRLLYSMTEARLKKSAASELSKEKIIHQVYHDNELMKKNIIDFQRKIRNQKANLRWKLAAKDGIIQKYEEDLAYKKWDNNIRIKQEIVKSTQRIRAIHSSITSRQKVLEEELAKAKATYEKVLKQNLHQEKLARDEKNKLLLQLQSIVRKYDTNIGDKIKENMHLQEVYNEQKKHFDDFMVYYNREELQYETYMNAKAEEERFSHEQKIMLFMMNRAARIIQRFWREWRKEQKKKAKKGKGSKDSGGKAAKKQK